MSMPKAECRFTVDNYLAIERASEERHEYLDGEIYLMAGESSEHGDISVNLVSVVWSQLKGTPCRARSKDTKVRSGTMPRLHGAMRGMFSYPDLVVICGEPQYYDENKDVVLNLTLIAEVLSPSTEAFDRGEKMARFQTWNPTLRDYLIVSQDQPQIERYTRQSNGDWSFHRYSGLEAVILIDSIQCSVRLSDVYDRIKFPSE